MKKVRCRKADLRFFRDAGRMLGFQGGVMVELLIRCSIWVVLVFYAVIYIVKFFDEKKVELANRCRKKFRQRKKLGLTPRAVANDILDGNRLCFFGKVITIPIAILLVTYLCNFAFKLPSTSPEQWGQMGDFFGGMLNPILAFASFIALLYTIRIQSAELRLTRDELQKSASAAERSALLEEKNLDQQKTNIERQFEIAKYQELMGMARDKINKITSSVFDDYTILTGDDSGGEHPIRQNQLSIKGWFEWVFSNVQTEEGPDGRTVRTLENVQSRFTQSWSGYVTRKSHLDILLTELILLGRILRDLESLSKNDVIHIRSAAQFAVGVLLCAGCILYKDQTLTSLNSDEGCPFDGFLDAYRIKLDTPKNSLF
jgi:hypothetical protein